MAGVGNPSILFWIMGTPGLEYLSDVSSFLGDIKKIVQISVQPYGLNVLPGQFGFCPPEKKKQGKRKCFCEVTGHQNSLKDEERACRQAQTHTDNSKERNEDEKEESGQL
ncbi:hypothetical protein RUM43_010025 [Polyplax serrata]|uniref:Uncharacterized protein n=1 Tax=Polyplax serrata TaxID=468196 RepID=A0AAN8P897_POLSC